MFVKRLGLLTLVFLAAAGIVAARLFLVQFVLRDEIRARAIASRESEVVFPAARGAIRDHDGHVLARDRAAFEVRLIPSTFRERALLHAVVDAWILLEAGPLGGRPEGDRVPDTLERLRATARAEPHAFVRRLLALPASRVLEATIRVRGTDLIVTAGGDLARGPYEMVYRLRQCLGVLRGLGLAFRRDDLDTVGDHPRTLGEALGVEASAVAERLAAESETIARVGKEVGFESADETFEAVRIALLREHGWMESRRLSEVRDALCLETFGSAIPSVTTMDAPDYVDLVRRLNLPYPDTQEGRKRAANAVAAAGALLAGELPHPTLGAEALQDGATRDEGPLAGLSEADELGLCDPDPVRVRDTFFEGRRRSPEFDDQDWITARRERDLRNRDRGGRDFLFGTGANPEVATWVVGPGRLEELGFRLRPTFVRDPSVLLEEGAGLRRLVGEVSQQAKRGIHGIEAALDDVLRGEPGAAALDHDAALVMTRPPAHGTDAQISLSLALERRLAGILPPDIPAGLAIVDVRTGAVLGMATAPRPASYDDALMQRSEREDERRLLNRVLGMKETDLLQRLGFLESEGGRDTFLEKDVIRRRLLDQGRAWISHRRVELSVIESMAPGWHRAFETPGQCPPGSVFKALTVLLGMREGLIDPETAIDCVGTRNRRPHGCKDHGHGITARQALEKSCNEFCYVVGRQLGSEALVRFYDELGFFDPVPGLMGSQSRRVPGVLRGNDPANLSIGGGDVNAVPVRVAGLAACLATGTVVRPWVCKPPGFDAVGTVFADPAVLSVIHAGMRDACGSGGTARRHQSDLNRLRVAAKTGTADHDNPLGEKVNEAWFVGFAPHDAPRYAFAVVFNASHLDGADVAPCAIQALEACAEVFGDRWW